MNRNYSLKHLFTGVLILLLQSFSILQVSAQSQNLSKVSLLAEEGDTTPTIELSETSFLSARGEVGNSVLIGTVHVTASNLTEDVQITPSNSAKDIFTTDVETIPAGTTEMDVKIFYNAKKIGKNNNCYIYFMCGEESLNQIRINGIATDPNNPPTVSIEPNTFKEFNVEVGKTVRDTIKVTTTGMPDFLKVTFAQDGQGFSCNTTMLYYVGTQNLVLTFAPKVEGEVSGTVTISNEFMETIVLPFKGKAVGSTTQEEKEGDELPLSTENPLSLLNEDFSETTHNKPLKLDGWKNLAMTGTRAWWGYTFPDYDTDNAGQSVAKVTAFDSKATKETKCQMMLVTPPLDFVNAETKLFTFRVMGNNLNENQNDKLEVCYIYLEKGKIVAEPLGVDIPAIADMNGKWQEFHIDLNGQNVEDVFFIGFRLTSQRGASSSAIYYIDDVSYGRTDLPYITASNVEMTIYRTSATTATSEDNKVTALNLTAPISISLMGDDADKFQLSTTELPATGGNFNISVDAPSGEYWAIVKLSSAGASDKYVLAYAEVTSGVSEIEMTECDNITVCDISGKILTTAKSTSIDQVLNTLPKGIYIIRATSKDKVKTIKIAKQ